MLILILTQKMSFDFHIARYLSQKMKECGGGGQSFNTVYFVNQGTHL
jgi:hypothetical protein